MTLQGDDAPKVEPSKRSRARRKAVAVAVPTGVALGAGAVFAYGAIPGSDGSVGVCYVPEQTVRFVDGPEDCRTGAGAPAESFLKINQQGPTGAAGPVGPAGPAGPSGLGVPVHPIAASDYLLEIDGIKGESRDSKHKDTIEIESFSWGATNASRSNTRTSGAGGGAGKVQLQDIHFVKAVDKSSPALFKRVASGQRIKKAVLFVRKAGGGQQEYMKVTMSDILVSSYQTEPQAPGSNTGNAEEISFNFTKIEFAYSPQNPDGSLGAPLTATYDLKAAKK